MDKALLHRRRLVVFTLAVALALAVVAMWPPKDASAEPPTRVDGPPVVDEGFCDFPVLREETGHVKFRELPGGDFKVTGRVATTLTNLDNQENQFFDGGGFRGRVTPLTDAGLEGDVLVEASGHNLLFDPGEGIFLIIGQATFTVAGGPSVGGDITILESHGRVIDVCERLA
jgi:hypothetical protein